MILNLILIYATGWLVRFTIEHKGYASPIPSAAIEAFQWPWTVYRAWFPRIKL